MPKIWATARKQYKLKEIVGKGSFGSVVKAKCLNTGKVVAIKLVENLGTAFHARCLLREIIILRKLTEMEHNHFFTKIRDIILPEGVLDLGSDETQANDLTETAAAGSDQSKDLTETSSNPNIDR